MDLYLVIVIVPSRAYAKLHYSYLVTASTMEEAAEKASNKVRYEKDTTVIAKKVVMDEDGVFRCT